MKSEDEKAAAKEHSKNATDFPSLQIWIEEGFLAGMAYQKARNESLKKSLLYWIECRMQEIGYTEQETGAFVPNGVNDEGEFWALTEMYERIQEWKPKIVEGDL